MLHGCCTAGKVCIRTRSGMIVIRNGLEAIYVSFVLGAFYTVPGLRGPGFPKRATMDRMFAHSYQG